MAMKRKPNKSTPKRKREIILAALKCFNQKGFTDTTMQEIRQRAGASYGSVYHHFKSKELLAAAVYLEGLRDYQAGMIAVLEDFPGPREGVLGMVGGHLAWVSSNPAWARFLINMRHAEFMQGAEPLIEQSNREFIPVVGRFLDRHMAEGGLAKMPKDVCMALILGPCQEFTRILVQGAGYTDLEEATETIGQAVWKALKPE